MSLIKQTQRWTQAALISEKQAAAILAFEKSNSNHSFWRIAYTIASLLIGLGIILLIAANWSVIPDAIKLLGDFAILGGLFYSVYWSIDNKRLILKEILAVISFLMIGSSIGLIGQIFHLSGGWSSLALFWALLGLPFVLISKTKLLSIVWLCLLFSACDYEVWEKLYDFILDEFTLATPLGIVGLYVIHYGLTCLDQKTKDRIILAGAAADFFLVITYVMVGVVGLRWGLFDGGFLRSGSILTTLGAHAIVFGFLGWRMYEAMRAQEMKSFRINAIGIEVYIFAIFASQFSDLWLSGIGFIAGGLLILGFLWLLRRTTRYIKEMEIFQ